jgi:predicted DCC family thiol-disulfide oxidoreductase YuxK
MAADPPVLMFDGKCNFCDKAVHFTIDHERDSEVKFTPIQSDAAVELLTRSAGADVARELRAGATGEGDPNTLVYVADGRVYTYSTAALRLASHLRAPYRWVRIFWLVPRPIRDFFYRWFAKNRYRWFGKVDACRVPTSELRARFLS